MKINLKAKVESKIYGEKLNLKDKVESKSKRTLDFDNICEILESSIKASNKLKSYKFYLRGKTKYTAEIVMGGSSVALVYYSTITFHNDNAFYALGQDPRIQKMFKEMVETNRILGIFIREED